MSTEKPTIVEALSAVMAEVQGVGKDSLNTDQNYRFRGIDAVVNAVGPVLRKHCVIVVPMLEKASYRDVLTSRGKPSRESTVEVRYRFHGPAGDFLDAVVPGEAMDFGDKGVAKAMSVAYRIALLQALCIPTDEPDADSQSYERAVDTRPQWDPVEQEMLRSAWESEIATAADGEALAVIGKSVLLGKQGGEISPSTYEHLAKAGAARKAELNGATNEPK